MALVTANEMHFHLTRICPLIYNYCILHLLVSTTQRLHLSASTWKTVTYVWVLSAVYHGGESRTSLTLSLERQRASLLTQRNTTPRTGHLFCKAPGSEQFWFVSLMGSATTTQLCHHSLKADPQTVGKQRCVTHCPVGHGVPVPPRICKSPCAIS